MLLDQKRTKRTVQIVAIMTSLAFAGVIFVVLGLIVFGGGKSEQSGLIDDAMARVRENPSASAYEDLASAYAGNNQLPEAVDAAEKAVELQPASYQRIQTLVSLQSRAGQLGAAIITLQAFTRDNPRHAEAFLTLGQVAERAGRADLAGLAYQRFVQLAPNDRTADDVRARLLELQSATSTSP